MNSSERDFSDVTVVITAHDPGPALTALLADLSREGRFAATLVIDSGSTDGSVQAVAALRPDIRVVPLDGNLGPCVARNLGLELAATPLVLWLDDDMRLEEGLIARLHAALVDHPEWAMVGPRLLFADRPETILYEGMRFHFSGLPHMRGYLEPDLPAPSIEVDGLTSAVLLVRTEIARAVGGFDPGYFYLMEDVEWSLRLRLAGHAMGVVPEAKAWNAASSRGLSLSRTEYPERRVFLHARNRGFLLLGTYRPLSLLLLFWPLLLVELAWLAFAVKAGHARAYLRGKGELWRAAHVWRAARERQAKLRRRTDGSLLGCPPFTVTETAARGPIARVLTKVFDGTLRLLWRPIAAYLS